MSDLLHRVEVCKLSDATREEIREIVRQEACQPALLGIDEAAAYFGISRRTFQYLLKEHRGLDAASINIGARRLWRRVTLDAWAADQEVQGQPKKKEAA